MDELRVAVVGLGKRGTHAFIPLLDQLPGYRIVALCDPVVALHERARAQLKRPAEVKLYARYEDVLADSNVDAIELVVRCKEQGALAAQALEADKHVNCEVPAAHTMEDCWRIVVAQERSGKVYQLAEQTRYWGFVDVWRKLVADGKLGHITLCEGQYFHYIPYYFYRAPATAEPVPIEQVAQRPEAKRSWFDIMPPIHYLPHELSPMLKVLDDRVVEVTAMSTGSPSHSHREINQPDMQVALMKTAKDTILRMAASFAQPTPPRDHHWYQLVGTKGCVEWKRASRDSSKLWLQDVPAEDMTAMDWKYERDDAPPEARGSGHGDADYYVHAAFRDAILRKKPLEFDVYKAMETAAPAILAAESIAQGSKLMRVPDFRPGPQRPAGKAPSA